MDTLHEHIKKTVSELREASKIFGKALETLARQKSSHTKTMAKIDKLEKGVISIASVNERGKPDG